MMTLILVVSALLIAFVGLLRYDIHKHKHRALSDNPAHGADPSAAGVEKSADTENPQHKD